MSGRQATVRLESACRCYFAYGSNMRAERVADRGLEVVDLCSGWLPNLGLRFNKADGAHPGSGHANIVYAPGEHVEGVLYTLASTQEITKMDPFEKAPWNYGRDALWVNLGSPGQNPSSMINRRSAWTYFANAAVQRDGLMPTRDYLDHLLAGADLLSPQYLERLRNQPIHQTVPR